MVLELKNLSFGYEPQHLILKNISLQLGNNHQHVIGLIGPNGSGKSTLFLNLVGVLRPTSGQIIVDGQPVKYHKHNLQALRQKIGIVFQDSDQQLFYSIVQDDVAFALNNLKYDTNEIQRRVQEVLEELDIWQLRKSPIQYLSGGQKKRVAIAGILVLQSEWLLLDEPTAGLDPDGRKRMAQLISHLVARGQKIILSSHDMDFMYDVCDYFYLLNAGQIIAEGTKKTVFANQQLLENNKLEQPWLVKLHQKLGLPLYNNAQELFDQHDSM